MKLVTFTRIRPLLMFAILGASSLFSAPAGAGRQAPTTGQMPAIAGVENPWDARGIINGLIKENEQFQPILDSLHPQDWAAKGASTGYIQQWQQTIQQTKDVVNVSRVLLQKPESLSVALDDYFRLEALDTTARSLEEGVRRYADRATADNLSALIAHNFSARERFRNYIQGLATNTEQNFKVADAEAQRCRAMISKEPSRTSKK